MARAFLQFLWHEVTENIAIAPPPPLDGMLVHCRVTPQQYIASTHLYTWAEKDNLLINLSQN